MEELRTAALVCIPCHNLLELMKESVMAAKITEMIERRAGPPIPSTA
jgi:hypothetical protein